MNAPVSVENLRETLSVYQAVLSVADQLEYNNDSGYDHIEYHYALIRLLPEDVLPTLLVSEDASDSQGFGRKSFIRLFRYDPKGETMIQPDTVLMDGGDDTLSSAASLYIHGDGAGLYSVHWSSTSPEFHVDKIVLEGEDLKETPLVQGSWETEFPNISLVKIPWYAVSDLNPLAAWTPKSFSETLEKTDLAHEFRFYIPEAMDGGESSGYLFPSHTDYILPSFLREFSLEEVFLFLCEIYARHGCTFADDVSQGYFDSQNWYAPVDGVTLSNFDFSLLSKLEKANVDTITQYLREMHWF